MPSRKFTADPEAARAERRDLIAKLESGFQRVQSSDEYRKYLATVSRFHKYSASNVMLIWTQRPDATYVAGFHTWLSLGRHVRQGERGIRIFAPMPYRRTVTVTNGETGESEDQEIGQLRFRAVSVFDVSQTDGADLPEPPVSLLQGHDERGLHADLAAIATAEGLTLDLDPAHSDRGANGYYDRQRRVIWLDPTLSPVMAAKTLCHKLAHHFAEHVDSREEHETIAESVAYIVLGHVGIDTGDYSFGYLASWTDAATFKAKVGDIQTIANKIIESIEGSEKLARAA
jgi:N-terminal domain of anti-restriction factor ArdC